MGKYFNVTVKPTIVASTQTSAFAAGDVLFDWMPFQVPKGSSRLMTTSIVVRGKDGADVAAKDTEIFFAKSINGVAPTTLGAGNDPVDTPGWMENLIGFQNFDVSSNSIGSSDDLVFGNMLQMPTRGGGTEIVLSGEPETGDSVGYDTLYVAGIAQGAYDFASTVQCDGVQATTQAGLTVKTISALNVFAIGDVLHDENDRLLGTVKSITDSTDMIMTSNLANATVNNKDVYNLSPIKLIFSFEK